MSPPPTSSLRGVSWTCTRSPECGRRWPSVPTAARPSCSISGACRSSTRPACGWSWRPSRTSIPEGCASRSCAADRRCSGSSPWPGWRTGCPFSMSSTRRSPHTEPHPVERPRVAPGRLRGLVGAMLGSRVALARENARLARELAAAEKVHGVIVDALAEAVTVNAADGSIVYVNDAAVRLLRAGSARELVERPPEEVMDRFEVYDEAGGVLALEDLPGSRLLAGEPEAAPLLVRNVVRATGEERWLLQKVSALRDSEGRLLNVVNVIEDLTTVKRAERAQRLLARASEAMATSLDPHDALGELVKTLVPGFARWAAVDVPGRDGDERVAVAGQDGAPESE